MTTATASTRTVRRPKTSTAKATTKTVKVAPQGKKLPPKPKTPGIVQNEGWVIKRVAEVPEEKFLTGYVNRYIDGLMDFDILDYALANKENVLLEGDTGTGKTSMVYAYAAYKKMPLYSLSSSAGSDPSQWRGHIVPTEDGGFRWQDGALTDLMRHGGILLVNEINFLPDRVASDLFGALDKRRKIELVDHEGEVIYAPDDFLIVGDMNPGYSGTRDLNTALRNRFSIQMVFDYDPAIESQLVKMPALLDLAGKFRDRIAHGDFDTPVSTNMLMEFERIAQALSLDFAVRNFVTHFAQDERASVQQVFDLAVGNLAADLDGLMNPGKVKSSATDVYDSEWDIAEDATMLYTTEELKDLTVPVKRDLAIQSGIPATTVNGMKAAELTQLLLGPVGGHPYWVE